MNYNLTHALLTWGCLVYYHIFWGGKNATHGATIIRDTWKSSIGISWKSQGYTRLSNPSHVSPHSVASLIHSMLKILYTRNYYHHV